MLLRMIRIDKQILLSENLGEYSPLIKTAYLGAVDVLYLRHNDRMVHFAHSLREVIDLLARIKRSIYGVAELKVRGYSDRVNNLLDNTEMLIYGTNKKSKLTYKKRQELCEQLARQYKFLSEVAHHRRNMTQLGAEKILQDIQDNLKSLLDIAETR